MVTHTYNFSYLGGRDWEDPGSRPAWREKGAPISSNKPGMVAHIVIPSMHGITIQADPGENITLCEKITKMRRAGGVA
jgi:hypothetical protein